MASAKFIAFVLAAFLLGMSENTETVLAADTCETQLDKLVACAPSVVPGSKTAPTQQCCSALKAMTHDCSCNTIDIINNLPAKCGLSPVKCSSASFLGLSIKASDTCATQLDKLVACAPSVIPGSTTPPSQQCCSALKAMTHDCSCETIQIINSLPTKCGLGRVKCSNSKSS